MLVSAQWHILLCTEQSFPVQERFIPCAGEQPEPLPCQVRAQIQALGSPAGKVLGSDALGDLGLSDSSVLAIQHALVKPAVQG